MKVFRTADQNALYKRRRLHKCGGDFLMRPFTRSSYRAGLIGGAALALSLAPMSARGQQVSAQTNASAQTTATSQQNTSPDYDRMDQFLNDHKNIDKDLRANPSLINSQKYLDHHKDLRTFLNDHPQMRQEFAQDRDYFMRREGRSDRDRNFTDRDRDRDRDANGQNPGQKTGQVAQLDRFLDDHQQIDKDLTANPSLANNNAYLDQHQDLRTFLNDHPDLREQFAKNPNFFMQRENQFDAREATRNQDQDRDRNFTDRDQDRDRDANRQNAQNGTTANSNQDRDQDRDRNFAGRDQDRDQNPNPDLRNWELARMDQFLDDRQQIDKELTAKPSLINDQKYLAQHQDLRLFLNDHPQVREEFTENPTYFMNKERRFDAREDFRTGQPNRNANTDRDQDRDRNFADRDQDRDRDANRQNPNPDLRNWELARMDQFLDDHQQIDKTLTAKPSLINDQKYLAQHRELQLFLNDHPQVREEFAENPSYFMNRENRFDSREFAGRTDVDRNYSRSNSKVSDKQARQMDQFLDKHKDIDRDLGKNPSLCNDDKYLRHHKDLRAFLDKNPEVRTQVASNSAYFTQRHERMQGHAPVKGTKPPVKTPIEQHETTTPAAGTH